MLSPYAKAFIPSPPQAADMWEDDEGPLSVNDADEIEDLQDFFDLQAYLEQLEEAEVLLRASLQ